MSAPNLESPARFNGFLAASKIASACERFHNWLVLRGPDPLIEPKVNGAAMQVAL